MLRTLPICLLVLTLAAPLSARPPKRKLGTLKHIVVDPGHGGHNMGTPGAHGKHEKYVTLPIANRLRTLLTKHSNAKVTMTRHGDEFVGLRERTRIANKVGGDILLSIHCNASPNPLAHGLEVYFLSAESSSAEITRLVGWEDQEAGKAAGPARSKAPSALDKVLRDAQMHRAHEQAEALAEIILDELHVTLRAPRRGVMQAPFAVLKEAQMPAVVVEVGFLTHAEEGKSLLTPEYQNRIALGIYRALLKLDKRLKRR